MRNPVISFVFLVLFINLLPAALSAQSQLLDDESDKCGDNAELSRAMFKALGDKWGYGYDDLLLDLNEWGASDFVSTDFIGESTQGREIYELTITDASYDDADKRRIYIHARTHPGEVQSFWVTNEMINYLLGESELGELLRSTCIFHIVPMYNPDGVELEYPRENANGVDIESNWNTFPHEVEVEHLKARFAELMDEYNPIEIALNMHSAVACKRYFVYHHANGTSRDFADMEADFITGIWDYFPEGIEPYSYYVSWTSGTPKHYPESWWWLNHGEEVMALTYEDMNCETAGDFDKTAFAILSGISDYLDLGSTSTLPSMSVPSLTRAYPNPFGELLNIRWEQERELQSMQVVDLMGRIVFEQVFMEETYGELEIPTSGWNLNGSGNIYLLKLRFADQLETIKLVNQ